MISNMTKRFAEALYKELDEDSWILIDSYSFKNIADLDFNGAEGQEAKELAKCIEAALKAIGAIQ